MLRLRVLSLALAAAQFPAVRVIQVMLGHAVALVKAKLAHHLCDRIGGDAPCQELTGICKR